MSLKHFVAGEVVERIRRGSSSPVVVDTPGGRFLVKLRGAAQGVLPLVAEVVVAEIAGALGLPVPERVLVELGPSTPTRDKNDELAQLLGASVGANLGFRWLDGATDLAARDVDRIDRELAALVMWLDGLVENADRTARNPNVLLWRGGPWLIDHGATLPFHYGNVDEETPRQAGPDPASHLFAARALPLVEVDAAAAALLGKSVLEAAVARIPDDFAQTAFPEEEPRRVRAFYAAYLAKRLKTPRPFVGR